MIVNCGKNEFGGITGGMAGDQTGAEFWKTNWYSFGQNVVLRFPNQSVGNLIADLAEEAAENDLIGYDQTDRLSFYEKLKEVGWHPKNITTPCSADCSSAVSAIVIAAGHLSDVSKLRKVSPQNTTWSMETDLFNVGFFSLSDSKYLNGDKNLLRGDIILNTSAHVCINVTNGVNYKGEQSIVIIHKEEEEQPVLDGEEVLPAPDIPGIPVGSVISTTRPKTMMIGRFPLLTTAYSGEVREDVEDLQVQLNLRGFPVEVNGIYDESTKQAVAAAQNIYGLTQDGECGSATWLALIANGRY